MEWQVLRESQFLVIMVGLQYRKIFPRAATARFVSGLCGACVLWGGLTSKAELFLVNDSNNSSSAPGTLTLAWNSSPDPVIGYHLYWRVAGNATTSRLDAGDSLNATIGGLQTGTTYLFSAVAYDVTGWESLPSNEIEISIPAPPPPPPPKLGLEFDGPTGSGAVMRLNFQGTAGTIYRLEETQDFRNWNTVLTTNCVVDGSVVLSFTNTTDRPQGFFRVVQQ